MITIMKMLNKEAKPELVESAMVDYVQASTTNQELDEVKEVIQYAIVNCSLKYMATIPLRPILLAYIQRRRELLTNDRCSNG